MKLRKNADRETYRETRLSDRKMAMSKEMKATLPILDTFTEEQADAIMAETRSNVPVAF